MFCGKELGTKAKSSYYLSCNFPGHMIVSSHELQFVLAKPKTKSGKVIDKDLFPLKVDTVLFDFSSGHGLIKNGFPLN